MISRNVARIIVILLGLLTFAALSNQRAFADTEVGGPIPTDTTWTVEGSPYLMTESIEIWENARLTIQPGVIVKVSRGKQLSVKGELRITGTSNNQVTFTSANAAPKAGDWIGIVMRPEAKSLLWDASGQNLIQGTMISHCVVQYAGDTTKSFAVIDAKDKGIVVDSCSISNNKNRGIYIAGGRVLNSRIDHNSYEVLVSFHDGGGGGVLAFASLLENNYVSWNRSGNGSGIAAFSSEVKDNTVVFNSNSGNLGRPQGAGIFGSNNTITGNTVVGNWLADSRGGINGDGGGIYTWGSGSIVRQNTLVANSASTGGAITILDGGTIEDNLILRNVASSSIVSFDEGSFRQNRVIANTAINPSANNEFELASILETGLNITGNLHDLSRNIFVANTAAYIVDVSAISFTNNIIASNIGIGLHVSGSGEYHKNTFLDNSNFDVKVALSEDVNGNNNYFGTNSNSEILSKIYDFFDDSSRGRFNYVPFLTSLPPLIPALPVLDLQAKIDNSRAQGQNVLISWGEPPLQLDNVTYVISFGSNISLETLANDASYTTVALNKGQTTYQIRDVEPGSLTVMVKSIATDQTTGAINFTQIQIPRVELIYLPLVLVK